MQILLSCAKTMGQTPAKVPYTSCPHFEAEAEKAIYQLMELPNSTLVRELKVNASMANDSARKFADFFAETTPQIPALLAYTGIVFQQIHAADFSSEDWIYAQKHLLITSFLYGLLRPLDLIRPYRLEGSTHLPADGGITRFEYWKPLLTDFLIKTVQADDGILVNLASAEMKRLFDWRKVTRNVHVITPNFCTIEGDKEKNVTVYTKMSRGQMTRFLLKTQLKEPEKLSLFEPDIPGAAVILKMDK